MTRLRDRTTLIQQKTPGTKPTLRNDAVPARMDNFRVHGPRTALNVDNFALFVSQLNGQLGGISERLNAIPRMNPADYVRRDEFGNLVDDHNDTIASAATSQGEDAVQSNTTKTTSRKKNKNANTSTTTVNNAAPLSAPPQIADTSSIGTTVTPLFSYADHTHGGVNKSATGSNGQSTFFTSTFEIRGDDAFWWDNSNKRLGIGNAAPGVDLDVSRSASGVTVEVDLKNTSNTATSKAKQLIQVAGATADDPFLVFDVASVTQWAVGIDNSDSDKFKVSRSATLGTTDSLVITTGDAVSLTGKVTTYENITTAGKGLAPITDVKTLTAQVADIADTAFTNASTAGLYRVAYYLVTTTADVTAGTVQVNIKFTDDAAARTVSSTAVILTATTGFTQGYVFARVNSGSLTYGVTHTGIFGTSQYALYATCERLN